MECLRRQTPEERVGAVFCSTEGCKYGSFTGIGTFDPYRESSSTDCFLQLQLRAGDDAGIAREDLGGLFPKGHWEKTIDPTLGQNQIRIDDTIFNWDLHEGIFRPALGFNPRGEGVGPEGHDETHITRGYN